MRDLRLIVSAFLFLSCIFPIWSGVPEEMRVSLEDFSTIVSDKLAPKDSIAVSELVVPTPDDEDERVAYAISELLTEILVSKQAYRVIEKKQVSRLIKALELQQTGLTDEGSAEVIGKLVGAKFLVMGSVVGDSINYTVTLRLVRVQTGEIVRARIFEISRESGERASRVYRPPAFRLHISSALNMYGISPEDSALHTLGMSFGFRYNWQRQHWVSLQLNPWFYHYYWYENRSIGNASVDYYVSARNAVEFMPGYLYRMPVSRFMSFNFGLHTGVMVYTLTESHRKYSVDGNDARDRDSLKFTPIVLPQVEMALLDREPFSFHLKLGYFFIPAREQLAFHGVAFDRYPMGLRLEGGVAFYW